MRPHYQRCFHVHIPYEESNGFSIPLGIDEGFVELYPTHPVCEQGEKTDIGTIDFTSN